MRLIDADALIYDIKSGVYPASMTHTIAVDIAESLIESAPTVDAVPVVRGEWEVAIGYDPNKKVQCQNCYKMAYEPTPHCPNCGAKMEDKPCG